MKFVTCEVMRRLILVAVLLLGAGVLLLVTSETLALVYAGLLVLGLSYLGLTLLLGSPLMMLVVLMLALLPGSRHSLEHCNH